MKKASKAAVTLGRLGGKARAKKLSKRERSAISRKGGKARWRKKEVKNDSESNG